MKEKVTPRRGISGQAMMGMVIIAIGVLFLLQTMGVGDTSSLWRWLPGVFVLIGVWQLVVNGFQNWIGPAILILVAGLAQLAALDIVDWSTVFKFWPLALVLLGLSILLGLNVGNTRPRGQVSSGEFTSVWAAFSGNQRQVVSQSFAGAEMTAVFGGVELDLRSAAVSDPPARVHVFAMFGGAGIKASPDMLIQSEVVAIFGGSEDNRRQRKMLAGETPEVVVTGVVMFGGFEIKDR